MTPMRGVQGVIGGAAVGTLGGLIGLGGAEFRLPLLIGPFGFPPLEAIIMNKAMSLIVVASALAFRSRTVPVSDVAANWPTVVNLLAGSLMGAWVGASWATRLGSALLYRITAVLLALLAGVLLLGHGTHAVGASLSAFALFSAGVVAGFVIGVVASLLGVAGGELLIPTLVLLSGADIKLAGSLSLAVSLPTMVVGFSRYSQDQSFRVLGHNRAFMGLMAVGSLVGTFIGGLLLGVAPDAVLLPGLAVLLLISAANVWRHQ